MEHNEIEYDEATNLPKLREGLFWYISESNGWLSISIAEKVAYYKHKFNFLFWDFNWGEETKYNTYEGLYGHLRDTELSDGEVRAKAENLYIQLENLDETKNRIKALVGVYPPKKLGPS